MKYFVYELMGNLKPDGFVGVNSHLIRVKPDGSKAYRPKYAPGMRLKTYNIVKVISEEEVTGIELLVNFAIPSDEVLKFPSDESALLWFKLQQGRQS